MTSLAVLGNVLAVILVLDRSLALWRNIAPGGRLQPSDAEFIELKAYTHGNIHELRDKLHGLQLSIEERLGAITARLAQQEAKTDANAASQTETLSRMLRLIEAQAHRTQPAKPHDAEDS